MTDNTPEIKKSSPRRIAASRANGAKSRGPVTAQGKERSSKNALKHGLASATIVLTTEDWPNYLQCRETYIRRFQPADDVELETQRAKVDQTYSAITPDVRTALAFTKLAGESRGLVLIGRYEARYSRQFYRALKALKELQSNRPPLSPPQRSDNPTDHRPLTTDHCTSDTSVSAAHRAMIRWRANAA